jgi:antirestriction protein
LNFIVKKALLQGKEINFQPLTNTNQHEQQQDMEQKFVLVRVVCGKIQTYWTSPRYPEGKTDSSFNIPNSVIKIERWAFHKCKNLKKVTITEKVASIEEYAFSDCSNLASVNLPESIKNIGAYAFERCKSLARVILPESGTYIYGNSFDGNTEVLTRDML